MAIAAYMKKGLPVLLLHGVDENGACDCGRKGCRSPGKHPIAELFPNGKDNATTDRIAMNAALRKYPNANVAIVPAGRLIVLDCDTDAAESALKQQGLPKTASVKTSRGRHFYVRSNSPTALKALAREIKDLDVLDRNKVVVVPPSRHKSGHTYRWERCGTIATWDLPDDEAETREAVDGEQRPSADQAERIYGEGERNNKLTSIAGALKRQGASHDVILPALRQFNDEQCRPRLRETEIRAIAKSVERYPPEDDFVEDLAAKDWLGVNVADWQDQLVPERKWVLTDWIPEQKVTALYADGGAGKTTLATQLAVSVALGEPFLGREVTHGPVFMLLAENDHEDTHIALDAVLQHYGAEYSDLDGLLRIHSSAGEDNTLASFENMPARPTALFSRLRSTVVAMQPKLIVFDPNSEIFSGNENNRNEVYQFVNRFCLRLAKECEAGVLILAHPSARGLDTGDPKVKGARKPGAPWQWQKGSAAEKAARAAISAEK